MPAASASSAEQFARLSAHATAPLRMQAEVTAATTRPNMSNPFWQSSSSLNASANSKLKAHARQGIPPEYRPQAWSQLSGGYVLKQNAGQGAYSRLAASVAEIPDDVLYRIESDVKSTCLAFPNHRTLCTAKGVESLSRLLLAYAAYRPSHQYAGRGMALIAAVFLLVFGRGADHEEDCFWTMVAFIEDKLVLQNARTESRALAHVLAAKLPAVAAHLNKLQSGAADALVQSWFSSGFVGLLPYEVVLRVWDALVVEGNKVAHRVALALFKSCSTSIMSCQNVDVLRRVLDTRVRQVVLDADTLFSSAFKGVGSFSGAWLMQVRTTARAELAKEVLERTATSKELPVLKLSRSSSLGGSLHSLSR